MEVLLANLSSIVTQLDEGSVVVLEPARVRVRRLPAAARRNFAEMARFSRSDAEALEALGVRGVV